MTVSLIASLGKKIADQLQGAGVITSTSVPKFSNGWVWRFQTEHQLWHRSSHGESGSADRAALDRELPALLDKIKQHDPDDIYNFDETAFFYRLLPSGSICKHSAPALKKNKARITASLCANMSGTHKLPVLFIGKSADPRVLTGQPMESDGSRQPWEKIDWVVPRFGGGGDSARDERVWTHTSGAQYLNSTKGWNTTELFQWYMHSVDHHMTLDNRKILMVMDNASMHDKDGLDLNATEIEMLPKNTTSIAQPLDQGVIAKLKRGIKQRQALTILDRIDAGVPNPFHVDLITAMEWMIDSWSAMDATTIKNCWRHAGLAVGNTVLEQ